jgi:hypothetical protein
MVKSIVSYLKAILSDIFGITFLLFDLLSLIIFFVPSISVAINNNFPVIKQISIWILLSLFLIVNIRLHRKQSDEIRRLSAKPQEETFEVAVDRIGGVEQVYADYPPTQWAAKIRLVNHWRDSVVFNNLGVEFYFFKPDNRLSTLFLSLLKKRNPQRKPGEEFKIRVPVYQSGIWISTNRFHLTEWMEELANELLEDEIEGEPNPSKVIKKIVIAEWDTKKPFLIGPHQEKRGPQPDQTSRWLLFGAFPPKIGKLLSENSFHLTHILFYFTSDHGDFVTTNRQVPVNPIDSTLISIINSIQKKSKAEFSSILNNLEFDPYILKTGLMEAKHYKTKNLKNAQVIPPGLQ